MLEVVLIDGESGKPAGVSPIGELVVRPYDYTTTAFQNMGAINTAYNLWVPRPAQQFVITMIVVDTNKDVGVDGSTVILYEASSVDTLTVDKTIQQFLMLKQTNRTLTGLFIKVAAGKWVNAKHDDDDVFISVGGYFIPKVDP